MKKILENKKRFGLFVFVIILFISMIFILLQNTSNDKLMLNYLESKYNTSFSVVNYISSKDYENGDTDILTVIPKNKLNKGEDIERSMGDSRISSIYYNTKSKTFSDNYFGYLIKDTYQNEINEVIKNNTKNYKLYFSLFSTMIFEDNYKSVEDFSKYKKENGNPSAIFNIFFETNKDYNIENAKNDLDKILKDLAKNEYPVTITAYFMENTKLSDLEDDLNLSIGVMNEKEEKQPTTITYNIDKDFSIKLNENVETEISEESDVKDIEVN